MALLNTDGSVAKAWHVISVDGNGESIFGQMTEDETGNRMDGLFPVGKAEPVNLQFGNFGISAWVSDTGGTSHASSLDEFKGYGTDNCSKNYSSCCSSPRMSDGPSKEVSVPTIFNGSPKKSLVIDVLYSLPAVLFF
ncbi:hypothetical protein POM88_033928 [Heracleum sosnowskyi]|uniref:Uncharacterized protein n=1 Tax=Heracleum sosnowskyi TaxID=360622 RepID=A0AAD8HIG2_9APIA|nr:hypothetical protein POM88_033928 [Heracleum sosnowskyi]